MAKEVSNYLLDVELVLALQILYGQSKNEEIFVLKPKGLPHWIQFVDAMLFRKKFPATHLPWKLIGSELKNGTEWLEMEEQAITSLDSFYSIQEYWRKKATKLDEATFNSSYFTILIDASGTFKKQLNTILKQYLTHFISQGLSQTSHDLLITEQFEAIKNYVQKIVKLQGQDKIELTTSNLKNELQRTNPIFADRNVTIRLAEIILLLQSVGAIELNKADFVVDERKEYIPRVVFSIVRPAYFSLQAISTYLGIDQLKRKDYRIGLSKYEYDKAMHKFTVYASNGKTGTINFRGADIERRIFETFLHLWEENNSGFYSRKEVNETYEKLFPKELDVEISKNTHKILNRAKGDSVVSQLLVLKGNYSSKEDAKWEFRILEDLP